MKLEFCIQFLINLISSQSWACPCWYFSIKVVLFLHQKNPVFQHQMEVFFPISVISEVSSIEVWSNIVVLQIGILKWGMSHRKSMWLSALLSEKLSIHVIGTIF